MPSQNSTSSCWVHPPPAPSMLKLHWASSLKCLFETWIIKGFSNGKSQQELIGNESGLNLCHLLPIAFITTVGSSHGSYWSVLGPMCPKAFTCDAWLCWRPQRRHPWKALEDPKNRRVAEHQVPAANDLHKNLLAEIHRISISIRTKTQQHRELKRRCWMKHAHSIIST